jgi:hypothetical protein
MISGAPLPEDIPQLPTRATRAKLAVGYDAAVMGSASAAGALAIGATRSGCSLKPGRVVPLRGEVIEVEGDDQVRVSGDGGGQDVPVPLVVGHRPFEAAPAT